MTIQIKDLISLILVVLTLKLVVSRYRPPVQESIQAIICIGIGTIIALVVNPSTEGFLTGVIGSGFAFYGRDLFGEFRTVKGEFDELADDLTTNNKNSNEKDLIIDNKYKEI